MQTASLSGLPGGPTVTVDWLREHLDDPLVRILDTRGRIPPPGTTPRSMRDAWMSGHVPGAAFVEWNIDFIAVEDPIPNQLADPERFARTAGRLGIGLDTVVVAYDDTRSMFAGRLWWAFRAMGHDAVRVLDGGWAAWLAADAPISMDEPDLPPTRFVAAPRPDLRWAIEAVADRGSEVVLVDARSRDRFAGTGGDPVGGHVPGAVNVPYDELVDEAGRLRPDEVLRAAFVRAGIDPVSPPAQLVTTCGSGISASVPLLALDALTPGAGVRGAVYDGSWAEWSRAGRPIATGDAPG